MKALDVLGVIAVISVAIMALSLSVAVIYDTIKRIKDKE